MGEIKNRYCICQVCGEYGWKKTHTCPPVFEYRIPEYQDDWIQIRAFDSQEAAEKACENEDYGSADYAIVRQGYLDEIQIRDQEGTVKKFSIEAEGVPTYYAREIKNG